MLSADGSTVYVNGRDGKLWALDSRRRQGEMVGAAGLLSRRHRRRSAPDGLIVAGGGPDTRLVAVRDAGDHADVIWRRDDITAADHRPARPAARSPTPWCGTATTGLALLVFDPADGRTVNSYPLPEADRLPGRGLGRPRPPRGDRDQRRPGVRLRPGLVTRFGAHVVSDGKRAVPAYSGASIDATADRGTCATVAPAADGSSSPWPKKKISASSVIAKFW